MLHTFLSNLGGWLRIEFFRFLTVKNNLTSPKNRIHHLFSKDRRGETSRTRTHRRTHAQTHANARTHAHKPNYSLSRKHILCNQPHESQPLLHAQSNSKHIRTRTRASVSTVASRRFARKNDHGYHAF